MLQPAQLVIDLSELEVFMCIMRFKVQVRAEIKRFFKLVYKITAGIEYLEQCMEGEQYLSYAVISLLMKTAREKENGLAMNIVEL